MFDLEQGRGHRLIGRSKEEKYKGKDQMAGEESEDDEEEEEEYENYAAMTQGRKKKGKLAETEELALTLRGGSVG